MATNFTETQRRHHWSPKLGWQLVRTWEGDQEEFTAFSDGELPGGYTDIQIHKNLEGWYTVEATYGQNDYDSPSPAGDPNYGTISLTWTLDHNAIDDPIQSAPNTIRLWNADATWPQRIEMTVDAWRRLYRSWVEGGMDPASQPVIVWTPCPPGTSPAQGTIYLPDPPAAAATDLVLQALAIQYAKLLTSSADKTFRIFQYVLRKTLTVANFATAKASHTYVNRVFTATSMMIAEPTLRLAQLCAFDDVSGLYWLKGAPVVSTSSFGQFEITQEWEGIEAWDEYVYGPAV